MNTLFAPIITPAMGDNKAKIYTVSELNSLVKGVLEGNMPSRLAVTGEIASGKLQSASGHYYFSLKDKNSSLPCVIWKSKFAKLKFKPENGMAVLTTGSIEVYTPHGKYQFYVDKVEPAGVGALQLAFEQMYKRLKEQGLFDDEHKKALPKYPQRIGILTSQSGAAVHDIADSIYNRWPPAKLFLYPVAVQGKGAAGEIAKAIKDVNRRNKKLKLDILIVGRGGGSKEDLWAFNEEVLARAIFDSKIPVISAVGHEIDTTIADLVADARASTPTKAGVIAVPDMREILAKLASVENGLNSDIAWKIKTAKQNMETILAGAAFRNPFLPVRNREQVLDEIQSRLVISAEQLLAQLSNKLYSSQEQIRKIEPHRLIGAKKLDLNNLRNRAENVISAVVNKAEIRLAAMENRLAALNPKSVLQRGYSITTNKKTGFLVRNLADVKIGDCLITELGNKNLIESKVIKK